MPTSDEDLQKMQDEVQKLREKVAAEGTKSAERSRLADNDIVAAQLGAERVRLESELAAVKEANKASNITAGAGAPLAAAKAEMELAVAQAKEADKLRAADAKLADSSTTVDEPVAVAADAEKRA